MPFEYLYFVFFLASYSSLWMLAHIFASLQCNEIRKMNSNLIVIGKTINENDKEEFDNEADDDDADNAEESEGEEFEQETGWRSCTSVRTFILLVCLDSWTKSLYWVPTPHIHIILFVTYAFCCPWSTENTSSNITDTSTIAWVKFQMLYMLQVQIVLTYQSRFSFSEHVAYFWPM